MSSITIYPDCSVWISDWIIPVDFRNANGWGLVELSSRSAPNRAISGNKTYRKI